jgi:hypothetical protein
MHTFYRSMLAASTIPTPLPSLPRFLVRPQLATRA